MILATLTVSAAILFLPLLGEAWAQVELRFLILLFILGLVAVLIVLWVLPQRSDYEIMLAFEVETIDKGSGKGRRSMELALNGQPYGQLRAYLELKQVFLYHMKAQRRLNDEDWRTLVMDRPRLRTVVADLDVYMLTSLEDHGTMDLVQYSRLGLVFGGGFAARYETLLEKVERWV